MSSIIINEDLRCIKTEKALYAAIYSLVKKISFRKITVKGICDEALISRAAFYAHFIDKYDLLNNWISKLWAENSHAFDTYEQMEKAFNPNLQENMRILKNLIDDADNETFKLFFDFILRTQNLTLDAGSDVNNNKITVLSSFYAGGIISYLLWQVKNRFPTEVPLINRHFYEMITDFKSGKTQC